MKTVPFFQNEVCSVPSVPARLGSFTHRDLPASHFQMLDVKACSTKLSRRLICPALGPWAWADARGRSAEPAGSAQTEAATGARRGVRALGGGLGPC